MRSMRQVLTFVGVVVACAVVTGPALGAAKAITPAPAFTADQLNTYPGNDWLVAHGDLASQNYSTLNQINASNVSTLKLAWSGHLGGACTAAAKNASCAAEDNALVYQGVMYLEDGAGDTSAIDATTGQHLWDYHPTYDPGFTKIGDVTRGIALGQGLVYIPRMDGSVVALDQMLGGVVWKTSLGDWHIAYHITAAPVYYDGMIIVGMSGGDSGNSDFMSAVDASSGTLLWHWNVIPHPGEPGYNTWGNKSAYHYAGGAIWNSVSVDPKLDMVYFGTGNQVPWNTRPPGNELWADSIIALHAHTGQLAWGYQTVHHDVWDDDIPSSVVLYDAAYRPYRILKSGTWVDNPANGFSGSKAVGVKVKYTGPAVTQPALALASKMGYVFILNRKTGKPLIPTPEMKVDQTGAAGLNRRRRSRSRSATTSPHSASCRPSGLRLVPTPSRSSTAARTRPSGSTTSRRSRTTRVSGCRPRTTRRRTSCTSARSTTVPGRWKRSRQRSRLPSSSRVPATRGSSSVRASGRDIRAASRR
jgi:glucose dehydrogenase